MERAYPVSPAPTLHTLFRKTPLGSEVLPFCLEEGATNMHRVFSSAFSSHAVMTVPLSIENIVKHHTDRT